MEERSFYEEMRDETRAVFLHGVLTTFGLDSIIRDREGGDVDTVCNVRETGVFRNEQNAAAYSARGAYDSRAYHGQNENYRQFRRDAKRKTELSDEYCPGKTIYYGKASFLKQHPEKQASLDHVIPAKEIHDDPARVMAGLDGPELANRDSNYAFTNRQFNSSKSDQSVEEFTQWREKRGEPLSEETKACMREKDEIARREYNREIERRYYASPQFLSDVARASADLGLKMGLRQAIGFVFIEIWFACEKEIKMLPSGNSFKTYRSAISRGIKNGLENGKKKYKEVLKQFGEGFVAGFFSGLGVTLLNCFFVTGVNKIRYVRQFAMILVRTGTILFVNPNKLLPGDKLKAILLSLGLGASELTGMFIGNQIAKTPLGQYGEIGATVRTFVSVLVTGLLSGWFAIFLERDKRLQTVIKRMNGSQAVNGRPTHLTGVETLVTVENSA
ncbi:MAG: hypothetical protein J6Z04_05170 [Clostridia bacterium]|nr:hypothetical protein [Clostridia bacterium]